MTLLLVFALTTAGFVALALALDRHHQQLWHRVPSTRRRWSLRAAGTTLLLSALVVCVRSSGWGTGWVEWVGLLTAAATCVGLV